MLFLSCQISVVLRKQTLHNRSSKFGDDGVVDSGKTIWGISALLLLSLTYCERSVQQDDVLSTAVDGIALSHLRWLDFFSKTVRQYFINNV